MIPMPDRHRHADRDTLESYLAGTLDPAREGKVEDHLRGGCLPCLAAAREAALRTVGASRRSLAVELFGGSGSDDAFEPYATWMGRKIFLIEVEKLMVPDLTAELMLRAPAGRREAVRKGRRYQVLALASALDEDARREGFRDVARAVELAELAVAVAECLDSAFYGARVVADAKALASAGLGNARRVAGDLFGAERELAVALELLQHGTRDPGQRAEVLSLLASLRSDQSRFEEAEELCRHAGAVYRAQGDRHREGRALLKGAGAVAFLGEPARAAAMLEQALGLLDREKEPKLVFWAHHNVAYLLNDAGRSDEAADYLESMGPLYERFGGDRMIRIRRRWLEGRIAAGLDRVDEAVVALQEVRSLFAEQERALDNALVTLDLAAVYLDAGRTEEVKHLVREMYPILRSQDVHRQALAALVLFKQAALTEAATAALARDVARYLERTRNNPYLPYEPARD